MATVPEREVVSGVRERPVASATRAAAPSGRFRLDNIDLLRGFVIVVMALDHARGHFSDVNFNITDVGDANQPMFLAYFLTRWITHYCAPTFVFLAGVGAFLFGRRVQTRGELSWFLITRGVWLIILELTVIRFSWYFNLDYHFAFAQVIWAIGWSMLVLAALVWLPLSMIGVFGVAMIAFHNLFDWVHTSDWGRFDWLWLILHVPGTIFVMPDYSLVVNPVQPPEHPLFIFFPFYPLIPWVGVLAAGYAFGAMFLMQPPERRRELLGLGLALTLLFVALRYSNLYGDRADMKPDWRTPASTTVTGPWSPHKDGPLYTVLSFINCQKYPPSLVFLLMTLGPAIFALGLFDRPAGPIGRFFITYGRVPLFFYIPHWFLLKLFDIALAYYQFGSADWLFREPPPPGAPYTDVPPQYGHNPLWAAYLVWAIVVLLMYFPCRWFADVKRRHKAWWLSYL
jgi:uncharacterized membrane protein